MSELYLKELPKPGMLWEGEPIEDYTKKELIEIVRQLCCYYDDRIKGLKEIIKLDEQ